MPPKPFVYFWDSLADEEGAKERASYVLKRIREYNKKARKILELGVGNGQVLVKFPRKYDIYGLDIEESYVKVCKNKIQRGKFLVASMHTFKTEERFDVIFSVFDSINFLDTFTQWKSTFRTVHNHLNRNGLFIFDMYTPKVLKAFRGKPATAKEFEKGYVFDKAIVEGNMLTWDFKIFEKIADDTYQINEYEFTEKIYPVSKVKPILRKYFDVLEANLQEEGKKILFVCRKKEHAK